MSDTLILPETVVSPEPDPFDPANLPRGIGTTPLAAPEIDAAEPPAPSAGDAFSAGFKLENDVLGMMDWLSRPKFEPGPPDYTPLAVIKDTKYEQYYLDQFVEDRSEDETRDRMARIDRLEGTLDIYNRSGTAGTLGAFAGGVASPLMLIPVGGYLVGAARAARAAKLAAITGGTVAVQEGILQETQETRTTFESLFAIGAGTVLGGVLGGITGRMTKAELATLERRINEIPGTEREAANEFAAAGAQITAAERGDTTLKGSLGVAEALSFGSPGLRLMTSPSPATRAATADIIDVPMIKGNIEGKATTPGGSVEGQVKAELSKPKFTSQEYRRLYGQYRGTRPAFDTVSRMVGGGGGYLSWPLFKREVARAALMNDTHPIAEVAAAARYRRGRLVDPLAQQASERFPWFKELMDQRTADAGYLTRMWNNFMVVRHGDELAAILTQHFRRIRDDLIHRVEDAEARAGVAEDTARAASRESEARIASMSDGELESLVDETINTIKGHTPNRPLLPQDLIVSGVRGPLKERMLRSLPTLDVWKFVEQDVEVIDRFYTRSMAADIALQKKFGSLDGAGQRQAIVDWYTNEAKGKSPKEKAKLDKRMNVDLRDFEAMVLSVRNKYKLPDNPDGLMNRTAEAAKALSYATSLGTVVVSSVSDIGRPIMLHGMRVFGMAFQPLMFGLRGIKLAKRDLQEAGVAWELAASERIASIYDVMDGSAGRTAFERGLSGSTQAVTHAFGLSFWNQFFKTYVGLITQSRFLKEVERVATGRATAKEIEHLAGNSIDPAAAQIIWREFSAHGGRQGAVWWPNLVAWQNKSAGLTFRAAVNREVDQTIVTPGLGDKPLTWRGPVGQVLTQFQSFAVSSVQRTIVSGLQQRDTAALSGAVTMLALGYGSYYMKSLLAGREPSTDPAVAAREAFDNSGLGGWMMNAHNGIERATGFGLNLVTGEMGRRYINVNALGAFLGPSFGKAADIQQITASLLGQGWNESDTHRLRKTIPLQNLFYIRWLFDQAETGINEAFGIPERLN